MSDNSRAIVLVGQRGVVASVSRQIAITEKVLARIQSVQNFLDVFNVPQDGSFEDAIIRIRPGGLILIAAGRYILDAGVTISKPLRIKGAGRDSTIFVSSVEGTILCVNTDGLFVMENVGILRTGKFPGDSLSVMKQMDILITGKRPGDLLLILAGEVNLRSCAFTGNNVVGEQNSWWGGLRIEGNAFGVIENTSVTCCRNGISVEGNVEIKLYRNCCEENEGSGIIFRKSASGTVENNICSQNMGYGIGVFDQSKVNLIGNRCEENKCDGINFRDFATGTVENNICQLNRFHGIRLSDLAKVNLIGNLCEENGREGILYNRHSREQ